MPTFNQLVRKGREVTEKKAKTPALLRGWMCIRDSDDMGLTAVDDANLEEPEVMTSMDGFSLEDDPDDNNMFDEASFFEEEPSDEEPVSYTHLDVYKRQASRCSRRKRKSTWPSASPKGMKRPKSVCRKPISVWWSASPSVIWEGACSFWT